jgi:hypothetical protein
MRRDHRARTARFALCVAAAAVVATAARPTAAAGAPQRPSCVERRDDVGVGRWSRIPLPAPESPPQLIFAQGPYPDRYRWHFSVGERDPDLIYIWNLWRVMKSVDGGCTWTPSFDNLAGNPSPVADLTDQIMALQATPGGAPQAYMLVGRGQSVPLLGTQDQGSDDWELAPLYEAGTGIPLVGWPMHLWVAPSDPRILYVELAGERFAGEDEVARSRLYRSDDAGRTWRLQLASVMDEHEGFTPEIADLSCPLGPDRCVKLHVDMMEVHPSDPDVLWTATSDGVFRSDDGGSSWRSVFRMTWQTIGTLRELELAESPAGRLRIGVFGSGGIVWSEDGGRTWEQRDPPSTLSSTTGHTGRGLIRSAASSDLGRSLVLLWHTAYRRQAQLLGPAGWSYVSPHSPRCDAVPARYQDNCLLYAAYVKSEHAYFAVQEDGSHLWKLSLAR